MPDKTYVFENHLVQRIDAHVLISGSPLHSNINKHYAAQINWAAPGTVVRAMVGNAELIGPCVAIDGGVVHGIEMEAGLVAMIDPAYAAALRPPERRGFDAGVLTGSVWDGDPSSAPTMLADLLSPGHEVPLDARVSDVLRWLEEMELSGRWADVSLQAALRLVNLSESRFLHLFSAQTGTPWRSYLVWRRAMVGMSLVLEGSAVGDASMRAGYADAAHFSRQVSDIFGLSPKDIILIASGRKELESRIAHHVGPKMPECDIVS
ncbi:conserved hypothetical protein [gamma proteobacterium NOR5-3]|nr:conserved hypothetical protein [gamma proteobacterium NOR5-3]